jgi:hypothetical protein
MVDKPNTFEDDMHGTFEQGKWILPLHFYLYPSNAYNNGYFSDIYIIWWDLCKYDFPRNTNPIPWLPWDKHYAYQFVLPLNLIIMMSLVNDTIIPKMKFVS